jgi:hypothetical protein
MATPKLSVGDRVRFSSAWLRNTSSATSPVARLRGTVIEVKSLGSSNQYATVRWEQKYFDSQETTVLCSNLQTVKKP